MVDHYDLYPRDQQSDVLEMGLSLCQRAVDVAKELNDYGCLAYYLFFLGKHEHFHTGRLDHAKSLYEEAVNAYEQVSVTSPDAFLPQQSVTLALLGDVLSKLRQVDHAIASYERALAICRNLATVHSQEHLSGVAGILDVLGDLHRDAQNLDTARECYEEALEVGRQLASTDPSTHFPGVAETLIGLGNVLRDLQEQELARARYEEALQILEKLAEVNPGQHIAKVAVLHSIVADLSCSSKKYREARLDYEKALHIYRELSQTEPTTYLPRIAVMLTHLSDVLREVKELEPARDRYEEATAVCRDLTRIDSGLHLPGLAIALNGLGNVLRELGVLQDAKIAFEELIEIEHILAKKQPELYLPAIADTVDSLAHVLEELGQYDLAKIRYEEAAAAYRALAKERPNVSRAKEALTLTQLGAVLQELGQTEAAKLRYEEALEAYAQLDRSEYEAHLSVVAVNFDRLGDVYRDLQQLDMAISRYGKALGLYQQLASTRPQTYLCLVADVLIRMGNVLDELGRYEEAKTWHEEALKTQRQMVGIQADDETPLLANDVGITNAAWLSRPVFITSTFRDTHAERDWLRNHVFPELEERLRERRCHLVPIDLRWGVETADVHDQEAKQLLMLKVCLAEVERSRPFLIGILGDRYGWIPPPERMGAAAHEADFTKDVAGLSVTELEIDFGVLTRPRQHRRCLFYFREPLPYDAMTEHAAARYRELPDSEPSRRLAALKTRLEKDLPSRVHRYAPGWDAEREAVTGLEAWGLQVLEDLWQELEAEIPPVEREPDWRAQERFVLEQFVEERTRHFVGRDELLGELATLATNSSGKDGPWGAFVTGPAGAGKSAVFAQLYRRLQDGEILLLAHAAGVSPQAGRVDALLRRWVAELAMALGEADALADDANATAVEDAFATLLGRMSMQRRVVLLLDALDQFEQTPRAQHLTWLPKIWPPNARLVATGISGTASESLLERPGVKGMEVPPLGREEAVGIAKHLCSRYGRQLNSKVLEVLLAKARTDGSRAAGNPLWLELAVEELNLLDADDFARLEKEFMTGTDEERMLALLISVARELPGEVEALYVWMLRRAEELHGAFARSFAELIAVSRAGWRETDFQVLMPNLLGEAWDVLRFAALRRSFRAHVVRRGAHGQWDFCHAQLREAVRRKCFPDAKRERYLHAHIADHLEALPSDDPLHESETMVHLIEADEGARAAHYYASALTDREADGAEQAVTMHVTRQNDTSNSRLAWVESLLNVGQEPSILGPLCQRFFSLDYALAGQAPIEARISLLQAQRAALESLVTNDSTDDRWMRALGSSCDRLGDLFRFAQLPQVDEMHRAALAIAENLAEKHPQELDIQRSVLISRTKIADIYLWTGQPIRALAEYRSVQHAREALAQQHPENSSLEYDVAFAYSKIGDSLLLQKQFSEALPAYQKALAIRARLADRQPENVRIHFDVSSAGRVPAPCG
jgi:tetratricopeptide (TPR) repeat protein